MWSGIKWYPKGNSAGPSANSLKSQALPMTHACIQLLGLPLTVTNYNVT